MSKRHEKSACCRAKIWPINNKRRQCSNCQRTWSVWSKRRGPKPRRPAVRLLERYVSHGIGSLLRAAKDRQLSPQALQARVRVAREHQQAKLTWAGPSTEPVVVVADALVEQFAGGTKLTAYLVLVRPLDSFQAVIMPPVVLPGTETADGWQTAFERLPPTVLTSTEALVCDGAIGLVRLAHLHGWVLQRCHFHLLHSLNNYVRRGHLSRSGPLAEEIHELVRVVLLSLDDEKVDRARAQLEDCARITHSRGVREVLSGFTKHWRDYRAYIYYDQLNLPQTSNSAESCIALVRELQNRAHGFRTQESFLAWLEFVLKNQQTITCNESNDLQNYVV